MAIRKLHDKGKGQGRLQPCDPGRQLEQRFRQRSLRNSQQEQPRQPQQQPGLSSLPAQFLPGVERLRLFYRCSKLSNVSFLLPPVRNEEYSLAGLVMSPVFSCHIFPERPGKGEIGLPIEIY